MLFFFSGCFLRLARLGFICVVYSTVCTLQSGLKLLSNDVMLVVIFHVLIDSDAKNGSETFTGR